MAFGGVERGGEGLRGVLVVGRLAGIEFVEIAGPNVPILVNIVYLFVALLLVFPVDDVVEGLADPAELVVFLQQLHAQGFV